MDQTKANSLRKKTVKLFKLILVSLAFIFVSNIVIDNPYTHRLIRGYLKKTHSTNELLDIQFNGISVSMFPPGIEVYGLSIKNKANNTTAIQTTHAQTYLSLKWALLGKFKLSSLLIENAIADIGSIKDLSMRISKRETSPPREKRDVSWPPDFDFPIENIILKNIAFSDKDAIFEDKGWTINLNHFNLNIFVKSWEELNGHLEAQDIAVQDEYFSFIERGNLNSNFNISKSDISIENAVLASSRLQFNGKANIKNIFKFSSNAEISVEGLTTGDLSLLGNFLDFENTYGQVSGEVKTKVFLGDKNRPKFNVTMNVKSNNSLLSGFRLLDSKAQIEINNDRIEFNNIDIYDREHLLGHSKGTLDFNSDGSYKFEIIPKNLPLSKLLDIVKVDFNTVDGNMTKGSLLLSGTSSPFKMTVDGDSNLSNFSLAPLPNNSDVSEIKNPDCDVSLHLAINNKGVTYDNTKGYCYSTDATEEEKLQKNTLSLKGITGFNGKMSLDVNLASENLHVFSRFLRNKMTGSGNIDVRIQGPYKDLRIGVRTSLNDASAFSTPIGKIDSNIGIELKNGLIKISELTGSLNPSNKIDLSNSLVNFKDSNASFSIKGQNITNLQSMQIAENISKNLPGTKMNCASIDGTFNIDFTDFDSSELQLNIDCSEVYFKNTFVSQEASGLIKLSKDGVDFKNSQINLTGRMPLESSISIKNIETPKKWTNLFSSLNILDVTFVDKNKNHIQPIIPNNSKPNGKDPSNLQNLPIAGTLLTQLGITGHLSVEGEIKGPINQLSGFVDLDSNAMTVMSSAISPLKAKVFLENGKLNANIRQLGSTLVSRFNIDYKTEGMPYSLNTSFKNFDMKFILPSTITKDARNYMYANGLLDLEGKISSFWESKGSLNIDTITLKYIHPVGYSERTIAGALEAPYSLELKNGVLVNSAPLKLSHTYGKLNIDVRNTSLPDNIDIRLFSFFDLKLASELFEKIEESKGSLNIEGRLSGTVNDPNIDLTIKNDIENKLVLGVSSIRPSIRNIDLDLRVSNKKIELRKFTATKGSGTIEGIGKLNLETKTSDGIKFSSKNTSFLFDLPLVKTTSAIVNSDLILSGNQFPFTLDGTIEIKKANANKNVNFQTEILSSLKARKIVDSNLNKDPYILFNIAVNSKDSIKIENKRLNLSIGTALTLTGDNNNFGLLGNVEIASGKINYKKDYTITRGIASFDNKQKIDPTLDVSAFSELGQYKVTVDVTGKSSDPKVDFSVDPATRDDGSPLTQLDILILMATGEVPEINQSDVTQYTLGYEAANALIRGTDELFEGFLNITGTKIIRQLYFDAYPSTQDGKILLRANAPINTGNNLDLIIQGDVEKMGVKAEYDLEESISTSLNFSKLSNPDDSSTEDLEDIDATVDLRFRFLFP